MNAFGKFWKDWARGAKRGKVTTFASFPLFATALIQILFSFDGDSSTHTNFEVLFTSLFAAFGLAGANDSSGTRER